MIGFNPIGDDGIKHLNDFSALQIIDLRQTNISDKGLEELEENGGEMVNEDDIEFKLKDLRILDVRGNDINRGAIIVEKIRKYEINIIFSWFMMIRSFILMKNIQIIWWSFFFESLLLKKHDEFIHNFISRVQS